MIVRARGKGMLGQKQCQIDVIGPLLSLSPHNLHACLSEMAITHEASPFTLAEVTEFTSCSRALPF